MALRRTAFLLARAYFCLFVLLTSFYCLLSFIPFSYHWFIKFSPVAWLPKFAQFHPYFWLAAAIVVWPTLRGSFYDSRTRRSAIFLAILNLLSGLFFIIHPLLLDVPNDYRAFIWSLLSLFPVLWLALLDLFSGSGGTSSPRTENYFSPLPAVFAGVFLTALFAATAFMRFDLAGHIHFGRQESSAIAWSLAAHLVIITGAFFAFEIARSVAGSLKSLSSVAPQLALGLILFSSAAILMRKLVLATLGFNYWLADVYAITVSLVSVLAIAGVVVHLKRAEPVTEETTTEKSSLLDLLGLGLVIVFVAVMPVLIGRNDWNFVLKKIVAAIAWAASLLLFYRLFGRRRVRAPRPLFHLLVLAVLGIACFAGYKVLAKTFTGPANDSLDAYAGYDTSFKLARDILTPALDDESYRQFYEFLRVNTSLGESVQIAPVPIRLVEDLKPTAAPHPHIFYFIVDSLRQDYLSPYNKQVTFTPNFEAFGDESVVFQNAFTRYGGTVLSVPALWTGSMQLHKQYIQPFYPMAELQKLVDADRYQKWITMDPVIKLLMHDDPQIDELDRNATYWTEYDLNGTMKEVERRIDARGANEPLFVYSQAHNTHTATLSLLSKKRPPTKGYPGFNNQFASEVERMDAGFGEFIAFLKQRGLYDHSIVIVTSDHGDSLGEFGRWGHGSTLFPEVVKIPLIVHLPASMRGLYSDPQAVAFSMDITPTLFYLLGHRPIRNDELLGRPLFTETKAQHDAYVRDAYLLVSSYGPVYARLSERGTKLFIVDAAAHQNFLYDLATDPTGIHNRLTLRDFPENERFIRQHVEDIARFYHYEQGLESPNKN